jgi:hypothetical protein
MTFYTTFEITNKKVKKMEKITIFMRLYEKYKNNMNYLLKIVIEIKEKL